MNDTMMLQLPQIEKVTVTPTYGKFIIAPLERGYGATLGNSLRRVLLHSIPGTAPTYVKIDSVLHEFAVIPGVLEDVSEIILNIKRLPVKIVNNAVFETTVILEASGIKEVKAGDIKPNADVEIIDPNWHIATLTDQKSSLRMEIGLSRGRGYVPAEKHKHTGEIGVIPVDSLFSPITKINYTVEDMRVGQAMDYNKVIFEVWTNGSISPEDAIGYAASLLIKHLNIILTVSPRFEEFQKELESPNRFLSMSLEELNFSKRARELFKTIGVEKVSELIKYSEKELREYPNVGKVTIQEIKEKLSQKGFKLRDDTTSQEKEDVI